MNIQELDVMNNIKNSIFINQRTLAEETGHSLGIINRSLRSLCREGYLNEQMELTEKADKEFEKKSPQNAVILAAGYGMRMVPINTETPKGMLEVHGEPLIERLIRQLHEAGIAEIYIVVGFMKEQYEYLIDQFGVNLIVNPEYSVKNNLHSMRLVQKYLGNTYIVPCDLRAEKNPFSSHELYSWYMVSEELGKDSSVRVNRKREIVSVTEGREGNRMLGICYLTKEDAQKIQPRLIQLDGESRYDNTFWEEVLYSGSKMIIPARIVSASEVVEINTYEQLRELDSNSNHLKSDAIEIAASAFHVSSDEIKDISILKKGMTNRSFLFRCGENRYIMRIPGEGTHQLINRRNEADVYRTINGKKICDDVIYMNPENGYKITEYIENARVCDPENPDDVKKCMDKLKSFHEMELKVDHRFDLFGQIEFYESLRQGAPSAYKDYPAVKENILSLKEYIDHNCGKEVLTHIDAVPDNFLFTQTDKKAESIRLIDWEYAGMQDPHVDIAMFCIYSFYDRKQIDRTIDFYFSGNCPDPVRIKIYCYVAVCGLLWSNWCEYKRNLGVDFGEYSLRQYRYAKEFFRIAMSELNKEG